MDPKYSAPAVEKLLDVVERIAASTGGYSINELARLTDNSVNAVYRICMVLRDRGYLITDPVSGHFVLGSKFYFLGKSAAQRMTLNTVAAPILTRLMRETGESTQLIVMHDGCAVVQLQSETDNPIRIHVETCAIIQPHSSAGGKCILAHLPDDVCTPLITDLMPFTAHTLIDPDALRNEFAEIRRTGIAFDREECMDGLRCIGAPVFGADGACIGGIDVMFPTYRVTSADESRFVPLVRQAAADISVGMGFDPAQIQYSEE